MIVTRTADRLTADYPLFDQMFRLRAATFKTRLDWDVEVIDGWERDAYDDLDPLYLMSIDPLSGQLRGSCRLLPTSGPHMMSEVFGPHFEPDATLCSPRIWEVTRFCVREEMKSTATPSGLNVATVELFAGVCELGRAAGISHVTGVYEPMMARIYRRAGMRPSVIGQSTTLGLPKVYAGLWELTQQMLRGLRAAGGFDASVLAGHEQPATATAMA
jgi:acyl homoserine lactone synthase